jgi:hypothetical protein
MSDASGQQCVWMQAEVVGYKLCDREFDCDRCPFDAALHGRDMQGGPQTCVGPTMQDGGTPGIDFISELSDAQARELIELFFPARQAGGRTAPHEVLEQRR